MNISNIYWIEGRHGNVWCDDLLHKSNQTLLYVSRWQDIVVGAPQFFMKDGEVGGAVYVYINKAGKWNDITPVRLNGTKDSMFGLAVENIGDINLDTYQGVALFYLVQKPTLMLFRHHPTVRYNNATLSISLSLSSSLSHMHPLFLPLLLSGRHSCRRALWWWWGRKSVYLPWLR